MPKEQSSEELSSLAARVLKIETMDVPTTAKAYNELLRDAKRLAGSVLTQDETPVDESDCGA